MRLQVSKLNQDESIGSELLLQHGTNADKYQLFAWNRGDTVLHALCDDSR